MVLMITIALSNGSKMVYEIDNFIIANYGSILNEESNLENFTRIIDLESQNIVDYEGEFNNDFRIKKIDRKYDKIERDNKILSNQYFLDNRSIIMQTKSILNSGKLNMFFIQIDEIKEIQNKELIDELSIVGENHVFAYMEFVGNDQVAVDLVGVKVEWKEDISHKVSDVLIKIKNQMK